MRLKLLMLTNLFPSPWDPGRATFNRQQFEHLGQLCDVSVLTAVDMRDGLHRHQGRLQFRHLQARYFTFFHVPRLGRRWQPQFWLASLRLRYGRWLRGQRFDCLLACWAYPDAVAVAMLANRLGLPYAVKVHGSDLNVMALDGPRRQAIASALQGAAAVIAVSQALADKAVDLGVAAERLHVLYNGVDSKRFRPAGRAQARKKLGLPTNARLILYVGNLKASKGCLDLLDALPALLARIPQSHLLMLGNGPDKARIVRRIASAGLENSVQMVPALGHDRLPDWYVAADVVCLPSHNEGVPNVLLEAMASGLPVVATRVGGIPEVVPDHAGILVSAHAPDALATALEQALGRSWDTADIVAHAACFDWQANAAALYDILRDMMTLVAD